MPQSRLLDRTKKRRNAVRVVGPLLAGPSPQSVDLSRLELPRAGPPAVVVGLKENGLGITRALHREGIPVIAVTQPGRDPARATRTCSSVTAPTWDREGVIGTLRDLGELLTSGRYAAKPPLLITQEHRVKWISAAREELSEFFSISLPAPSTVDLLHDKAAFSAYARRRGWPLPWTAQVRSHDELLSILDQAPFPCILKPTLKNAAYRQHAGAKAFRVESRGELLRVYERISQWEAEAVIQEFIAGGDERIAYCLGYYGEGGLPLAEYAGVKLRQYPSLTGGTAVAAPCPPRWRDSICELTAEIFRTVGYRGLGSVEFKMTLEDDQPVIVEPTVGRTNYQNEIAVLNGVNLPAIAYYEMIGAEAPPSVRWRAPATKWVDFANERRSSQQLIADGAISVGERRRILAGRSRSAYFRWLDPLPGILHGIDNIPLGRLVSRVAGERAKNRLKEFLGR